MFAAKRNKTEKINLRVPKIDKIKKNTSQNTLLGSNVKCKIKLEPNKIKDENKINLSVSHSPPVCCIVLLFILNSVVVTLLVL